MSLEYEPSSQGPMVMIDGADDLATAFQGSGIPQQLQFALQVPLPLQVYRVHEKLPPSPRVTIGP